MKKNAVISFTGNKNITAEIFLTGSKSESNRALIISALSGNHVQVSNLSDAADTVVLANVLKSIEGEALSNDVLSINIGHAGTAMRFLTAYLSTLSGSFYLTGSERMKERPIKLLVDSLRSIGANIEYADNDGFPPLRIQGPLKQVARKVKIRGDVSSQYLSGLLIIAPSLPMGLSLEIEGDLTSRPYVEMTLAMLAEAGISYCWEKNLIEISNQTFSKANLIIEPDWSAASYWYSIAALSGNSSISLPNLKQKSLQGDSHVSTVMEMFGVYTDWRSTGISLSHSVGESMEDDKETPSSIPLNLKNCPDLAQTIIVCAAAKGIEMSFTGLETLKIKETNRVLALQNELSKFGVLLHEENEVYTLDCKNLNFPEHVFIKTYDDHRMAMAFAPLAFYVDRLEIEDYNVVEKSYPDYWLDLQKAGFNIKELN